ncbi:MAG: acetyl-CoA carboxylase biotin carboxyl carrier protein [Vallitaleaceae bacterium]|jgi:acetyl-CoA carboxylase biotin carboxyl carrier protein|nr:acetyl-CoA carboxylase biotin carboxyl carrier protein [Vallitaleaceae bacterium]
MNIEEIKSIIEALKDTDYSYIKIKNKDTLIELGKDSENSCCGSHNHGQQHAPMMYPQMMQSQMPIQPQAPATNTTTVVESASSLQVDDPNIYIVTSPIVGTYYASSSPEADAFAKVGDVVKADQTICIIEAMKLMNEIEAEVSGEIVEILAKNEEPVEYGQTLFKIRKA